MLVCGLLPAAVHAQFIQQGPKLAGTAAVGVVDQGNSVSLSGDGNTAIVGGPGDNSFAGAAWVFTRSGARWTQQIKLVRPCSVGAPNQVFPLTLSRDSQTAIVGGDR